MSSKNNFFHFSKEWMSMSEKHFLQQDWAQPHIANAVLDVLKENFDDRVLSNHFPQWFEYGWSWLPYSPDLNPCDYFLRGFLKDTVYKNNPHTIKELKQEISAAVINVSEETLAAVVCKISDVGCRWSWTSMVQILKMFSHDCQSPKITELRHT
jgi:hypothetical protein